MNAPDRAHPADDRLIALYFDGAESGDGDLRPVRQHLHGCEACTWRYAELVAPLEQLRRDASSEADEVFNPARLNRQRAVIMDRLADFARAPRVIPFPAGQVPAHRAVLARPVRRWVAVAAAAGLLIGVSAGRFIGSNRAANTGPAGIVALATPARTPAAVPVPATYRAELTPDEAFLFEFEAAVSSQRIDALRALDDLTPHAREVAAALR